MAQTISEYCENNVLVIPQALFGMKDVSTLMHAGESAIFYKTLEHDLLDIEFVTRCPCLVYIESGREVITTHDNHTYELSSKTAALFPAGIHLHSDFANTQGLLKAYLVFFGEEVLTRYLSGKRKFTDASTDTNNAEQALCLIDGSDSIAAFFQSVQVFASQQMQSNEFLQVKLQELLHLLAFQNKAGFSACLAPSKQSASAKRNINRLLENTQTLRLTVNDLAHLSGRSLSSFNRDFKAIYDMPPKQWLIQRRMQHAHQLLQESTSSVTDIALDVGYENSSHFIKAFKETYGMTPNQLRS